MCAIWIFIFDTDQPQIYSAARRNMSPLPALASLTTEQCTIAALAQGYLVAESKDDPSEEYNPTTFNPLHNVQILTVG